MLKRHSLVKFISAGLLVGTATSTLALSENYTIKPWSFSVSSAEDVNKRADSEAQTQRLIVKVKAYSDDIISAKGNSEKSAKEDKESFVDKKMKDFERILGVPVTFVRVMGGGAWVIQMSTPYTKAVATEMSKDLMSQDSDLVYVHPDYLLYTQGEPNDPFYANHQWHLHSNFGGIRLADALDHTEGSGSIVAVVDTGYLPHVDLVDNVLPGYDFVSDLVLSGDGDGRDDDATDPGSFILGNDGRVAIPSNWHGTHVAGTVAAVTNNNTGVAGVAPKANVLPVRVLGKGGAGHFSDIADGVRWAAGGSVPGVPANPNPANVINLSLGGPHDGCEPEMASAINYARNIKGAVVVVAAGNSGLDAQHFTPANCENVLTVAANDRIGNLSSYSNRGEMIDITAPGGLPLPNIIDPCDPACPRSEKASATDEEVKGDIDDYQGYGYVHSTYNSGLSVAAVDNYKGLVGTSMAAPHVAGVAALLFSLRPDFTATEVEQTIINTARVFPSDSECDTAICGAGIVNAKAAVESSLISTPNVNFNIGLSGAWYEPATSGQGLEIEIMPSDNFIFAGWYTYSNTTDEPLASNDVGQRWFTLSGNYSNNASSAPLTIYSNTGGRFDQPPVIDANAVGQATLTFQSCSSGKLDYTFTNTGLSGSIPLTRLTPDIYCQSITTGGNSPGLISFNTNGINAGLTAAWYEPATSGQGFQIEVIPSSNQIFIPWFTYSRSTNGGGGEGEQRWFTISGSYVSGSRNAMNLPIYQNLGGQFDNPPITDAIQIGSANLYFHSCTSATLNYSFSDTGQSGSIPLTRLTANSFCSD